MAELTRCNYCGGDHYSNHICEQMWRAHARAIEQTNAAGQGEVVTQPCTESSSSATDPAAPHSEPQAGDLDALARPATHAENLRVLAARMSEHLSPAEKRELDEAASAIVALRQEVDDAKDDVARLHKDKMSLWAEINFPGGFKERAEAAEGLLHDSQRRERLLASLKDRSDQ